MRTTSYSSPLPSKTEASPTFTHAPIPYARYFCIGLGTGILVTGIGCGIALFQADVRGFIQYWNNFEALPLITLQVFLLSIARSSAFTSMVSALTLNGSVPSPAINRAWSRFALVFDIWAGTMVSTAAAGINAHGARLVFVWVVESF